MKRSSAKRGDSLDTANMVRLYQLGYSSPRVASELGCTSRTVLIRLRAAGVEPRGRGKVKTYAAGHPWNWKGDEASYTTLHRRVYRERGQPSNCESCGRTDDGVAYDWANLTGNYANANDYKRLCRPCHRRFDWSRNNAELIELIRGSTESARALERRYGVDHRVIKSIRTSKSYDGSDVCGQVDPAVQAYFETLRQVQERVNEGTSK